MRLFFVYLLGLVGGLPTPFLVLSDKSPWKRHFLRLPEYHLSFFVYFCFMNAIFSNLPRVLRWLIRFRKRCGYGIHSPFAFDLVTGVIYEKGCYYAYRELSSWRVTQPSRLRLKDDQLLFRLANYVSPSTALAVGEQLEVSLAYLQAGCRHCQWQTFAAASPSLADGLAAWPQVDLVYLDQPELLPAVFPLLLPRVSEKTLIIVRNIRKNKGTTRQWREVLAHEKVRVSFDLYDFGLLFFESRLNKENYIINYF